MKDALATSKLDREGLLDQRKEKLAKEKIKQDKKIESDTEGRVDTLFTINCMSHQRVGPHAVKSLGNGGHQQVKLQNWTI